MEIKKSKKGRKPVYDQAFKNAICFEVLSGSLSYSEARTAYAIKGQGTIRKWVEQYQEQCLKGNLPSMKVTDWTAGDINSNQEASKNEDLHKKNQELEAALKMARLKITALETMIDIAESELNIDIRKKPGTKQ